MYELSSYLEQQGPQGDDALSLIDCSGAIWFCVADGAGGIGGGSEASSYIASAFEKLPGSSGYTSPECFERFLKGVDLDLERESSCGETTGIVGKVENGMVFGASVGDSEAWIFNTEYTHELTTLQHRKPLLGSGASQPIGFGPISLEGSVLVGSDGLFKYSKSRELLEHVERGSTAEELSALVKQQTHQLQDDVSSILIRKLITNKCTGPASGRPVI